MQSKLCMLSGSSLGVSWTLQGLRPWATSVVLSEIYLTVFLRSHILFLPPLFLEVMDLCIGVVLCKVIWEIGPQSTFLDVSHLFTLLPTMGTCYGAQLNCTLHILFCVATVWGLGLLISVMSSLREEYSTYTSMNTLCLPTQCWACRIYCINIQNESDYWEETYKSSPMQGVLRTKGDFSLVSGW